MKIVIALMFVGLGAQAQTLNIAETSGKGKLGMFAASNALFIRDFTTANYSFAYAVYGASNRADIYAGLAQTTLLGQTQLAASGGANVNVLKKWISVSDYFIASTPLNQRESSCGLMLFNAVIASKTLGKVTPYIGYSATVPVGQRQDKLFTPASTINNLPVGVMFPKGKFAYFAEYDFGGAVKTVGLGVAFTP